MKFLLSLGVTAAVLVGCGNGATGGSGGGGGGGGNGGGTADPQNPPTSSARLLLSANNEGVPATLQFTLGPVGRLTGTVTRADGSTSVANAQVSVIRNQPFEQVGTVVTDSGGRYDFANVSAGVFQVSVTDPATGDGGPAMKYCPTLMVAWF